MLPNNDEFMCLEGPQRLETPLSILNVNRIDEKEIIRHHGEVRRHGKVRCHSNGRYIDTHGPMDKIYLSIYLSIYIYLYIYISIYI